MIILRSAWNGSKGGYNALGTILFGKVLGLHRARPSANQNTWKKSLTTYVWY